ncbi:probable F-box protein At2g36090 [Juglans microcarpa x Juglans regia]|uniref:probable F-box protein At2g36090 n=1 Tax=Juglans microcarpa x Juglans regia TaxID=2249226 RepID=UPI001B7DF4FA|nr:probable F-box protein At2g36090 [Juglans microcarpa x Juglans regia]
MPIRFPDCENAYLEFEKDLALSWIMIEPLLRRQAVNLSSHKVMSVQRHWLSGEIHVRFATILIDERGSSLEFVECGVVVRCSGSEGKDLQLREVSLQVKNMDVKHLNGRIVWQYFGECWRAKREGRGGGKENVSRLF